MSGFSPTDIDGMERLARHRTRIVAGLSGLLLAPYFALMTLFAFDKPSLGRMLRPGLSLWLALGPDFILAACLLSLGYVIWANRAFDTAAARLVGPFAPEPDSSHDQ